MIEYSYNDTLGVITININNINIKKRGLFIITAFIVALSMITFTSQYCEARTKATNQTQIAGSNNVEKAWNFYISQGFSKEATAVFEKYFERAGVVAIDERTKYAEEIYRKYA